MGWYSEEIHGPVLRKILLFTGLGGAGLALYAMSRNYNKSLSEFGLTDEEHASKLLDHAEKSHSLMDRAEAYLAKRKSRGNCQVVYNSLKDIIVNSALANENFVSIQSGKAKYSAVISNLSTDYNDLYKRFKKRCGTMIISSTKRRKCVSFSRRKGKRYCKKYSVRYR